MPATFAYVMLALFQVCAAVVSWIIIAVLSMSPRVRQYRARLLGAVAGGAIGGFAGVMGVYLATVGFLLLAQFQSFAGATMVDTIPAVFLALSVVAYLGGVFVGARALWRVAK